MAALPLLDLTLRKQHASAAELPLLRCSWTPNTSIDA